MVTKEGHLFHIDFGRFLGNAQMFGAIRRDRAPFVLTSDMAYVVNGADKPTPAFQVGSALLCITRGEQRERALMPHPHR